MEDRLGIRLVHYPENALVAENAYKIISSWCQNGPPNSSDKLSNYVGAHVCDYYNARDVVNTQPYGSASAPIQTPPS